MKTPRADQCKTPSGVAYVSATPEYYRQVAPGLWAAACDIVQRRGLVHGTDIDDLCLEHGANYSGAGEQLIYALCHERGPARFVEYAPTHSQLAFAGLGPSAYQAPEAHPCAWYIGRKARACARPGAGGHET